MYLDSKENEDETDEDIQKLNEAIYKAIPNMEEIKYLTNQVNILRRNIWGPTCQIPIVLMTDDGHIKDGVIFKKS